MSPLIWQTIQTDAGRYPDPPGDAERWSPTLLPAYGSDEDDHWFRTQFTAPDHAPSVTLLGLATICDVFVDGDFIVRSESMFARHHVPVAPGKHELAICARALTPALAGPWPARARWRTKIVTDNNLRWIRSSLLGRTPGFSPGPPAVGPWRPVLVGDDNIAPPSIRTSMREGDGVVTVRAQPELGELEIEIGPQLSSLPPGGGEIRLHHPERWWPHTHGDPFLYRVRLTGANTEVSRNVGFRCIHASEAGGDGGLGLRVNDIPIFVRGAIWTPVEEDDIHSTLERACEAGLNMIRVVGTMTYESPRFHDTCDELGLLVWQDLMFANMDYPFSDAAFEELATDEVRVELEAIAGRPSLTVVCGNSEVEQQVAMLGLNPQVGRPEFFESGVPSLMNSLEIDAVYLPSAPSGGARPFSTDAGVTNYFGVGAYLRPISDARRAGVRFASECLAFANVPDATPTDHAEGVMRDPGTTWDFADVRDHYLNEFHNVRRHGSDYWERSRFVPAR